MKTKVLPIVASLFICLIVTLSAVLIKYSNDLLDEVAKRDLLIRKNQSLDSLNCLHSEKYNKVVEKYVTNECSLILGKKVISFDELINLYSNEVQRGNDLEYELEKYKDSLTLYKYQLNYVKKDFNIKFETKSEGKYRVHEIESKSMDSARILLKHFRDRISYDTICKCWSVRK